MTAVDEATPPRLGIRANWRQFSLLLAINAFVGAMVGLERSVLPTLAKREFGVSSATVALAFLVAFGVVKAASNLAAGHLADRVGRKRLLILGWVAALPVPLLVLFAHSWSWIVAANVLLGINQGLAWSMTVVMKVDLAGPARRGLALGLNESVGYAAVALAAFGSAQLAVGHNPREASAVLGLVVAGSGLLLSALFARDTGKHVEAEMGTTPRTVTRTRDVLRRVTWTDRSLSAAAQAGLVNNLNDALAWGLLPIFLASRGLSVGHIGVVAALYPAAWAIGQIGFGALSDRVGRKGPIVGGMWLQATAITLFPMVSSYWAWIVAALLMGVGTALVYPTLLAVVADVADPSWRASAIGAYRLWRDLGYAVGGLTVGVVADAAGMRAAFIAVAVTTALSGIVVATRMDAPEPRSRKEVVDIRTEAR
ncbi:MAG: MFS transporter [Actinomycetota bacterium]|nr:MFS transporter [Actinomycetota bacterium]